jgi:hypothetical protein
MAGEVAEELILPSEGSHSGVSRHLEQGIYRGGEPPRRLKSTSRSSFSATSEAVL